EDGQEEGHQIQPLPPIPGEGIGCKVCKRRSEKPEEFAGAQPLQDYKYGCDGEHSAAECSTDNLPRFRNGERFSACDDRRRRFRLMLLTNDNALMPERLAEFIE